MGNKLKVMLSIICLVVLLAIPAIGGCAAKEKALSDLAIKVDWVEPVALIAKPYDAPKSIAGEYNTFHVILSITNPNNFLVTVESIEAEVYAEGILMGTVHIDSPLYLPAGKGALARFPLTANTRMMMLELAVQRTMPVPDALKTVLATWAAIQDGKAKFQVKGGAQVKSEAVSRYQEFDLRWP